MITEPSFTIGVEEEYLLVERETRELVSEVPAAVMAECRDRLGEQVSPEFLQCQVEVGTRVCTTIADVPPGTPCDPLDAIPEGVLQVCATLDPADPSMVLVVVRGRPRNLLPLVPLPWTIDAPAEMHRVTFQR